eukprot:CAMPEP_0197174656 /NCGR_PEP_ID=MMETSP1423-20130617/1074_1 /TAXON_ID=476441 /ORGANISM="Pseudo-nitzschia heimii, Strain UNC1101" /LENGTH=224 /DNA_ID=CAMNT_0042623599 /DNA_START=92 /DNA_END=767 /DNA_ORIENTATION=+
MATRGVFQCRQLTLRYCEHGGSSRAVREYLASGRLLEWAAERPTVNIRVKVSNGRHPNLQADYLTTAVSNKSAMNGVQSKAVVHQVCLKSKGMSDDELHLRKLPSHKRVGDESSLPPPSSASSSDDEEQQHEAHWKHPVEAALNKLYNRSGRKMTKFTKPVYTDTPSIQGVWTPSLDLHLLPEGDEFDLKIETLEFRADKRNLQHPTTRAREGRSTNQEIGSDV